MRTNTPVLSMMHLHAQPYTNIPVRLNALYLNHQLFLVDLPMLNHLLAVLDNHSIDPSLQCRLSQVWEQLGLFRSCQC